MKRISRICALIAVLAIIAMLVGCGGPAAPEKGSASGTPDSAPETMEPDNSAAGPTDEPEPEPEASIFPLAEEVELEIALPLAPFANALITELNDWVMFREMEKITNVHWKGSLHPALNATETFSMLLASGDYPDVMTNLDSVSKNGNYQNYIDGIIIDLTDLIAQHAPDVQKLLDADPELTINLGYEGENGSTIILNFPMLNAEPSCNQESGLQYRGDWLEAEGLAVPETISEFEEVLKAFKVNHDSYYYIGNKPEELPISNALNVRGNYDEIAKEGVAFPLYVRDGKVICGLLQDEFREYLTIANRWYKNGYLHPDFFNGVSANVDAETGRVESGEFGSYRAGLSTFVFVNDALETAGNGGYMVPGPNLLNENHDDTHLGMMRFKLRNRSWVISTACEQPELVCQWINYLFTDEGYILYNYGVEGETFDYVDGQPKLNDLVLNNPDGLPVIMTEYVYTNNEASDVPGRLYMAKNLANYDEKALEARQLWLDSYGASDWVIPRAVTLNTEEQEIYNSIFGDILTYFQEMNLSFVTGEKSLDEFDAYRDKLVSLGMDKVVELYQAAYDRYAQRLADFS